MDMFGTAKKKRTKTKKFNEDQGHNIYKRWIDIIENNDDNNSNSK